MAKNESSVGGFDLDKIGPPAFVAGMALSMLAAIIMPVSLALHIAVACLGIIAGLLNIRDKEIQSFLLSTVVFTISANTLGQVFGQLPGLETAAPAFFGYVVAFVGPAAAVVAFKQIWMLAKD